VASLATVFAGGSIVFAFATKLTTIPLGTEGVLGCTAVDTQPFFWTSSRADEKNAAAQSLTDATVNVQELLLAQADDGTVVEALQQRKALLLETLHQNPLVAHQASLAASQRAQLARYQNCLEQPVAVTGRVEVEDFDDFEGGRSVSQYRLRTSDGDVLTMLPSDAVKTALVTGRTVQATGFRIDDVLFFQTDSAALVTTVEQDSQTTLRDIYVPPSPTGPQPTLVLMYNFNNTSVSMPPKEVVVAAMDQNEEFSLENSYGATDFSGVIDPEQPADVFDWFTIDEPQQCQAQSSTVYATVKTLHPEINFQSYKRVILVAPYGPDCGWSGNSSLGITNHATPDGVAYFSQSNILASAFRLQLVAHELGHGLGVMHANFYNTTDFTTFNPAYSIEYGDNYSIMGNHAAQQHHNVAHKDMFGWLDGLRQIAILGNGTYTIYPQENADVNAKTLKLQRRVNEYLYLEYRQPIGFDSLLNLLGGDASQGALLYLTNSLWSLLIDPTGPPPSSVTTVALKPGMSFIDPVSKHTVEVLTATPQALTVQVTVGKIDFTPPAVTLTGIADGSYLDGVVNVTADATDPSGISKVEFYHSQSSGPFAVDTEAPYTAALDTTTLINGPTTIIARAFDASGVVLNAENNQAEAVVNVIVYNGTSVPPTVTLTAPADGASIVNPVNFTASVTPGSYGVKRVEFIGDGEVLITLTEAPYRHQWSAPDGQRNVAVRVVDYRDAVVEVNATVTVSTLPAALPVTQVTTNTSNQVYPDVSEGIITWQDFRTNRWSVFYQNLTTGVETGITDSVTHKFRPAISGQRILWNGYSASVPNPIGEPQDSVYGFDIATGLESVLAATADDEEGTVIAGEWAAWHAGTAPEYRKVVVRNLATGVEKLVDDSGEQSWPAIAETIVAYQSYQNGQWDIYTYSIETGAKTRITTSTATQQDPAISGNTLAYEDNRNGNWDIYTYDMSTGVEQLLTGPGDQRNPDISGPWVVFEDERNGTPADVYAVNLLTDQELFLANAGSTPSISGNIITWSAYVGAQSDIFRVALPVDCADGTPSGQCNASQQYCNFGTLVQDCQECGVVCPLSQPYCAADGACQAKCTDGTNFNTCNAGQRYCSDGVLLPYQCGACNVMCPTGYTCSNGSCCRIVRGRTSCVLPVNSNPISVMR
jgi:beta propeller repeat protein